VLTVDYIRIPDTLWLPTPLVSDGFSGSTSDGLGHAETSGLGSGGSGVSWTGATWAVSGGVLKNAPTQGSELLTNADFAAWTADNPDGWTITGEVGSDPAVHQVASGQDHTGGGAGAANFYASGAGRAVAARNALTVGQWFAVSGNISFKTGASILIYDGSLGLSLTRTTSGAFSGAGRASNINLRISASALSAHDFTVDDISLKTLTLSTLFRTANLSTADVFASVAITLTAGTQAGLVLNLDSTSSPANFIIVYHNGTQVVADKCVAGTYTNLFSSTVTYVAGARLELRKDGTAYRVYYNTVFVGSQQTVSDAGIISNTLHGTFSTYELNEFDNLVIYPTGNSGEYSILDSY